MKKLLISTFAACLSASVLAGGLNTNSNQNASFERQMSQNGIIDIAGMYANPAGTAFLANGWHFSYTHMSVWQQRNITTTFPLFSFNGATPGETTHKYNGKAKVPCVPSLSVSYNHDKWSVNAHLAIGGGGGKCSFPNGLGSFESLVGGTIAQGIITNIAGLYAQQAIPAYMAQGMTMEQALAAVSGPAAQYGVNAFNTNPGQYLKYYTLDSQMEGHSYVIGGQFGATYKVLPNLSVFGGVRIVYGTNGYDGYIKDISYETAGGSGTSDDITIDCSQKAWGVTPIIGIDWKVNDYLNLAAKYEVPTKMVYKNSSTLSPAAQDAALSNDVIKKFSDGYKVREDIPGILAMGAMVTPVKSLRLMAGWNYYFDKHVKKGVQDVDGQDVVATYKAGDMEIDNNTWEINTGVEYDLGKYLTVSASWQRTSYGISDAGMTDLSFNNTNNMIGFGVRVKPTSRLSFDLGFMHTIYQDRIVITPTALGDKVDVYSRKNDVIGIGINYEF
ncbi:MAG: hypothetical protein J6W52_02060 [Bacteroidaceae bacterium]|nr:hypothetical protein [Bacteroidaceae bacterium]